MGENKYCYVTCVKARRKGPLGRPRNRWADNVKMYLGKIVWGDTDWIDVAQDKDKRRSLVNTEMNLRVL
jgi:hypothetical protein